jgi:HEAT repeat protein
MAQSSRAAEAGTADEQVLRAARIKTDDAGLIAFFRKLSLTDDQQRHLDTLLHKLGNPAFKTRAQASAEIVSVGPPALPFLRNALADHDLEVARRAQLCIEEIEQQKEVGGPLTAATRLIASRKPAGAATALLAYLPFNEDEGIEEEILSALVLLGEGSGAVDPALSQALQDRLPARRAAAAFVLGRSSAVEVRSHVQPLLGDPDPKVRLRAAQGLAAGRERTAVPVLIALLGESRPGVTWRAEELLYRIAGEHAPAGEGEDRKKLVTAWQTWWRDQGRQIDLGRAEQTDHHLGLTLLSEMDSNKVWESGPDGKPRWKLDRLQGPMDAQVLPGGRVLVAEYQGQRVTERDLGGKVLWSKRLPSNPITCQRLANGNTFIATHHNLLEVTRDGREIFNRPPGPGLFLFGAQKLPNGHVICIANPGVIEELDPSTGKVLKSIRLGRNFGGWCGMEVLPGGRFLVALFGAGKVLELDGTGRTLWECNVAGACHATRLPNGHTLVASMANQRLVEVDRNGKPVRETSTDGRPWRVHYR